MLREAQCVTCTCSLKVGRKSVTDRQTDRRRTKKKVIPKSLPTMLCRVTQQTKKLVFQYFCLNLFKVVCFRFVACGKEDWHIYSTILIRLGILQWFSFPHADILSGICSRCKGTPFATMFSTIQLLNIHLQRIKLSV